MFGRLENQGIGILPTAPQARRASNFHTQEKIPAAYGHACICVRLKQIQLLLVDIRVMRPLESKNAYKTD